MAYSVTTSKGTYYLNSKERQKKDGTSYNLYFWTTEEKDTTVPELPAGYEIAYRGKEKTMPVIRKIRQTSPEAAV